MASEENPLQGLGLSEGSTSPSGENRAPHSDPPPPLAPQDAGNGAICEEATHGPSDLALPPSEPGDGGSMRVGCAFLPSGHSSPSGEADTSPSDQPAQAVRITTDNLPRTTDNSHHTSDESQPPPPRLSWWAVLQGNMGWLRCRRLGEVAPAEA